MKNLIKTILIALVVSFNSLAHAEISVIVNPGNANSLSQNDIKKIFLGKMKKYPDGSSVIAVNLASGDSVRGDFESNVVGKSPSKMKAYWAKLVFSGKGNPPKEVASDAEAIALVAENPAVIGYVDSSKVSGSVKVVGKF